MLGDFVKPREIAGYPPEIRAGIHMHQRVDAFSDSHPAFATSRQRFQPPYRRYAGIVVDLAYDHFLAKHWERYSADENLADFAQRAYRVLSEHREFLPVRLQCMLPHMIAGDWLCSYRELESVGQALRGVSRRLKRENPLPAAIGAVRANYPGLQDDFGLFFPELVEFCLQADPRQGIAIPASFT